MSKRLIFVPAARMDLVHVHDWYESHRLGLGTRFLAAVDKTLQRLVRFPESSPVYKAPDRISTVRRFPYVVLYEIEAESIVVYAVVYASQDPARIEGRLPP